MKKDYVRIVKNKERKITIMKNKKINQRNQRPQLRFSPTAWAKLLFMRDMTDNEVAGFGITEADDLLLVKEFIIIKQQVTPVSFIFDDQAIGDFFEEQVDLGRKPEQFARIWLHSHPGNFPEPSSMDEKTFERVFGSCNWSIMFIVARSSNTYARLRFNTGPGGELNIPVCVDYSRQFEAANFELWKEQYKANVTEDGSFMALGKTGGNKDDQQPEKSIFGNEGFDRDPLFSSEELLSEIDLMDPMEREMFMGELAVRSDFWDEENEVFHE
jgi:proteasome lid subunit RPN8/RPN11